MTLVASEVRVAGTGEVSTAAVGATAPTSEASALTGYTGLGYTTPDGVTLSRSLATEVFEAWQSLTPVRIETTGQELTAATELMQSNAATMALALGLGEFTDSAGSFGADIDVIPPDLERALVIDWVDGEYSYRFYVPRVRITETGDTQLARTTTINFPLTFSALAPLSGTKLAYFWTDDPAFDPGA